MKTNKLPYTVSARKMEYDPEAVITVKWGARDVFTDVKLKDMGRMMNAHRHLDGALPVLTTSSEGRHFLAPCLMVTRPEVAVITGTPVGDGITFSNRRQMRKMVDAVNTALLRASLPPLASEDTRWMISPPTPMVVEKQLEFNHPTVEQQHAECPF